MAHERTRRPSDPLKAAEQAFKKATIPPPAAAAPVKPAIPGAKEMVSLRLDQDILEHFQADGPGWQDRINDALRSFVAMQSNSS